MKTLSVIGVGAFGEFILKHITPYFETSIYDEFRDLTDVADIYNVKVCNLDEVVKSDILIISVPVRSIQSVANQIKNKLKAGQLIMDVASVKCFPTECLVKTLPSYVDIVGLHPLFGPQSGKISIHGQNIAVVNVRGHKIAKVSSFLSDRLGLNVIECSAEEHDRQMAYVQGLTHMIAKVFQTMDMPHIYQETKTFSLLRQMVEMIKDDSDELFNAIQTDNPYVEETKKRFFQSVKDLEGRFHEQAQHHQ